MRGSRIRVGVIGTGFGAQVHLPALAALPSFEIAALCGRDLAKVEQLADIYDIRHVFTDYRDLIACPEVEAITVATPPALHHPTAVAAIAAGKHVLCEKPMARNANEAREMARMAETTGVTAMLCHEFRFAPARAWMKELIDEGYLGAVSLVQLSFLRPLLADPRGRSWNWLMDAEAGGGMLGALGSHFVDTLRWWFGEISEVAGLAAATVPAPWHEENRGGIGRRGGGYLRDAPPLRVGRDGLHHLLGGGVARTRRGDPRLRQRGHADDRARRHALGRALR